MERSCTVNLRTQKQTLSWKGVAYYFHKGVAVSRVSQKQTLSWKGVAL